MSKKLFKDTKVGRFLSNAAPGILNTVGNVLPDNGVFGLVKNLIHKDPVLPPEDKEKALLLLQQDIVEMKEISKRHEERFMAFQKHASNDSYIFNCVFNCFNTFR